MIHIQTNAVTDGKITAHLHQTMNSISLWMELETLYKIVGWDSTTFYVYKTDTCTGICRKGQELLISKR